MKAWNIEQITPGRPPLPPGRLQSFEGETNPYFYSMRLLALHVYPESRNFIVEADWSDYPMAEYGTLSIRCLAVKDCVGRKSATYDIPIELAGAAAVAFHSEHEGHPLELSWNGEVFHPKRSST